MIEIPDKETPKVVFILVQLRICLVLITWLKLNILFVLLEGKKLIENVISDVKSGNLILLLISDIQNSK